MNENNTIPLTFSQKRLWFLEQLAGNGGFYNMLYAFELTGELDVKSVESTLLYLVNRHEIFRTVIINTDDGAVQQITSESNIKLISIDLTHEKGKSKESKIHNYINEEQRIQFDLTKGPLLRLSLLKLEDKKNILIVTMHHIISDAWSMKLFFSEFGQVYNAYSNRQLPKLPDLALQYADFAVWQKENITDDYLSKQLRYWSTYLKNAPEQIELPYDFSRGETYDYEGARVSVELDGELHRKLIEFNQQHKVTDFMTLLSILHVLLHKYSRQGDILVGAPLACRDSVELEEIIGFFVNTVVFRTKFDSNIGFIEILEQIKQAAIDAVDNADVPFEQIVSHLGVQRQLNYNPLFQVMFVFEHSAGNAEFKLNNLKSRSIKTTSNIAKFDLTVIVEAKADKFNIVFEYATTLFAEASIRQMANHFKNLTAFLLKDNTKPIENIDLLTDLEKNYLIDELNNTEKKYQGAYLHQMVEREAKNHPELTAIISNNSRVNYAELNKTANQLARYLIEKGHNKNDLIAISLHNCPQLVMIILAVLKIGATYVPIDPEYPQDRIQFILDDSGTSSLFSSASLKKVFKEFAGTFLCIEDLFNELKNYPDDDLNLSINPEDIVYMIYTSGSTGMPKGVLVRHNSVSNLIHTMLEDHRLYPGEHFIQNVSFSFDPSVWTTFLPLVGGATLLLPDQQAAKDPNYLITTICDYDIRILHAGPTILNAMMVNSEFDSCQSLRTIISGGEVFSIELLNKLKSKINGCEIYNVYGPTEATIHVTSWTSKDQAHPISKIPIGKPIANTQIYILDKALQLVPRGVVGEIYIGGMGVAKGYWKRDELTAERFVANPFMTEVDKSLGRNDRLYHTGDLGRYLVDGNIEFLGRSDAQVKLRGFRIELGEIESVIQSHENVRQVLVRLITDSLSVKRLVAYIIPGDFEPTAKELQSYLSTKLPNYMVPSAYVLLSQFPLLPNGKIDRESLPLPVSFGVSEEVYVEPVTEIEKLLSQLWSEILGVERVGINDNFFELGGDSIISIQLISRARQKGVKLAVKDVFEYPTIAGLSQVATMVKQILPSEVVIKTDVTVPMTPIQRWFFSQAHENYHYNNQAILLVSQEHLDSELLQQSLKFLVGYHDGLRLRYEQTGGKWRQYYSDDLTFGYKDEVFSGSDEESWLKYLKELSDELQSNLNLNLGPVFRVAKIQHETTGQEYVFLVLHHLLVDGVSWRILLEDLATVYKQLQVGNDISLGVKTTSYGEWSEGLVSYVHSPQLKDELNYWQQIPHQTKLELPVDKSCSDERLGCEVNGKLSKSQTDALLTKVPRAYQTQINDVLLTALVQAVGNWSGDYEVLINVEGHGREEVLEGVDISRTVGWFTTIYPVHLQLSSDDMLGSSLQHIKEQLRAVPEKGIGYGILRYLQTDMNLTNAQVRISFNYLGQWDTKGAIGDLFSYAEESTGRSTSKQNVSPYWLDINAIVKHGQFQIRFGYNKKRHNEATMTRLCAGFIERLQQLIDHCVGCNSVHYTPSDFPMVNLSQKELDKHIQPLGLIEDIYPLSPMQSGLLFQSLYEPDSSAYFVQSVYKLVGTVDGEVLKRAWEAVIAHYGVLRTGFIWEELAEPVQVVLKEVAIDFEQYDWREKSEAEQEHGLADLLEKDRQRGFCLCSPPLIRFRLMQLNKNQWCHFWSMPHILGDGWCSGLLIKDLKQSYHQINQGKVLALNHRRPYKTYIQWLMSQDKSIAKDFWQGYLEKFAEPSYFNQIFAVNFGSVKSDVNKNIYGNFSVTLEGEKTEELRSLAKKLQVTVSEIVQCVWALLLSFYLRRNDVVFGITVSGRDIDLQGIDQILGIFINTVPLRVKLSNQSHVHEVIRQIHKSMRQINQNAYLPLNEIQKSWRNELSKSNERMTLFDHLLIFENQINHEDNSNDENEFKICGMGGMDETEYSLTLSVVPHSEQINFNFSYKESEYTQEMISKLANHFEELFTKILTGEINTLADVNIVTNDEKQQLLHDWNHATRLYPKEEGVAQLFEKKVSEYSDKIAVIHNEQTINYFQLNKRANKLARYLSEIITEEDSSIAICLPKSIDFVVSVLAILKIGMAYLPLDVTLPKSRLNYMLENSNTKIVIINKESPLEFSLEKDVGCMILLDEIYLKIERMEDVNLDVPYQPEKLAYIIYTSGSTGLPKGVMIANKSITNQYFAWQEAYELKPNNCHLQMANVSFDVFTGDLFRALCSAATIVLCDKDLLLNIPLLHEHIQSNNITHAEFVPAVLKELVNYAQDNKLILDTFHYLVCSSDKWSHSDCLQCRKVINPATNLINTYGVTEMTVDSTYYDTVQLSDNLLGHDSPVPIGRLFGNTEAYILNEYYQPMPVGVCGELYLGGLGVSKGYIGQPSLTKEKFIPNPFVSQLDEKTNVHNYLYKTGDLVCYLPDGNIQFFGRIDHQVKIYGYRIELAEIEYFLEQHELVEQAVVSFQNDDGGKPSLVAYICGFKEKKQENELNEFFIGYLQGFLPEYMIPKYYFALDKIPLNQNGKVDRNALSELNVCKNLSSKKLFVKPANPIESKLSELWQTVLNIDSVGVDDNFFGLGGDSIISIRLVSVGRREGLHFTVKQLFEYPTIRLLASAMNVEPKKEQSKSISPQNTVTGIVPFSPIQLWFYEQDFKVPSHYNQSVLLELNNKVNISNLELALKEVIAYHDSFRLRFSKRPTGWQQYYSNEFNVEIQSVTIDNDTDEIFNQKCNELQAGFTLDKGSLFNVSIIRTASDPSKFYLLWVVHHLIIDAVSWQILLEDLKQTYLQISSDAKVNLPTKTDSYKVWSDAIQQYAYSDELKNELNYWQQLPKKIVNLPKKDYDDDNVLSLKLAKIEIKLDESTTNQLIKKIPVLLDSHINSIFLTALTYAISEWSGENELFVELEGHGRSSIVEHVDLIRTIGWFTSLFPFYLTIDRAKSIISNLKDIDVQFKKIPNKGSGFGVLKYLRPDIALEHSEPEICFNYLGQYDNSVKHDLFSISKKSAGNGMSVKNQSCYAIEINAMVLDDKLNVIFIYNNKLICDDQIKAVLENFRKYLVLIAKDCSDDSINENNPPYLLHLAKSDIKKNLVTECDLEDIYPLSAMQSGLLYDAVCRTDSNNYIAQNAFELRNGTNLECLTQAWNMVITKYSVLRSGFIWRGLNQPAQIIMKQVNIPWDYKDLSNLSSKEQQIEIANILQEDKGNRFNLSNPPLMRMILVKISEQDSYLIWSQHHILLDGWSAQIVLDDVKFAYQKLTNNETVSWSKTASFKDYFIWVANNQLNSAKEFWQKYLAGVEKPTYITSVLSDNYPDKEDSKYSSCQYSLSKTETDQVKQLASDCNVTVSCILQGVWCLMLSHFTNTDDLIIGVTDSGRSIDLENVDEIVGVLMNTLPLRVKLNHMKSVKQLFRSIYQDMISISRYSQLSLAEIQSLTPISKNRKKTFFSLFDHIFVFENFSASEAPVHSSYPVKALKPETIRTEYPLTVIVIPGEKIKFIFEYNTSFVKEDNLKLYFKFINSIIERITKDSRPVDLFHELEIKAEDRLSEREHQWIAAINNTNRVLPELAFTIDQLFEKSVELSPGKIAIRYLDQKITYQELNEKSNQLARYLHKLQIRRGDFIGVSLPRSIELMVAMLAVLKLGCAYIPIDYNSPLNRMKLVLSDSGATVILTDTKQASCLKVCEKSINVVNISELQKEKLFLKIKNTNLAVKKSPQDLAYVIYTSGSTGRPKGVALNNNGVVNRLIWMSDYYDLNSNDVFIQKTSIGFDVSVWELFLPLIIRAELIMAPLGAESDPVKLIETITRWNVSVIHFVPSLLNQFVSSISNTSLNGLRYVFASGEALPVNLVEKFYNKLPNVLLHNLYGPTEASIDVTYWECPRNCKIDKVPIGRPIYNTKIFILDKNHKMLSIGQTGEIYIGGIGLAREYLNNQDLTKSCFVNIGVNNEVIRLYSTGDLGRYLLDGNIEYLGRLDDQIKLHGNRIELGEIESVLLKHQLVNEASVVSKKIKDQIHLIAFIVFQDANKINDKEQFFKVLKEYLAKYLPKYMLPSVIMDLEALPITLNGKIDKNKLKSLEINITSEVAITKLPQSKTEQLLAEIWIGLLPIKQVGINDDFFEMGGHSLLVLILLGKIQEKFGQIISLSQFLNDPTIAGMSHIIENDFYEDFKSNNILPLNTVKSSKNLFLVHPGGGQAIVYRELAGQLTSSLNVYGVDMPLEKDFISVEKMANFYLTQIRNIQPKGPFYLGGWSFGGIVAYEMAKQLIQEGELVNNVLLIDSFNIAEIKLSDETKKYYEHLLLKEEKNTTEVIQKNKRKNRQLLFDYFQKVYDGRVVLLKSTEYEEYDDELHGLPNNGWNIEKIKDFKRYLCKGNHDTMIRGNYAHGIAKIIVSECRL